MATQIIKEIFNEIDRLMVNDEIRVFGKGTLFIDDYNKLKKRFLPMEEASEEEIKIINAVSQEKKEQMEDWAKEKKYWKIYCEIIRKTKQYYRIEDIPKTSYGIGKDTYDDMKREIFTCACDCGCKEEVDRVGDYCNDCRGHR